MIPVKGERCMKGFHGKQPPVAYVLVEITPVWHKGGWCIRVERQLGKQTIRCIGEWNVPGLLDELIGSEIETTILQTFESLVSDRIGWQLSFPIETAIKIQQIESRLEKGEASD
jgi:hypothetical protein